jgi:cation transport regulator
LPYQRIDDLPESVREHLPKHAQEIYRAAFNSAWIAWAAVKRDHEKDDSSGQWQRKEGE